MSDDIEIIRPQGRLDSATTPDVEKAALAAIDAGAKRLVIDFEELVYISSAGLRMVLAVAKRMAVAGGHIAIASMAPQVADVFHVSGVADIVDVHPDAESASQVLRGF